MWTKLNPFKAFREILTLWDRQIQAQEQANAIQTLALAEQMPASSPSRPALHTLVAASDAISARRISERRKSERETPRKKLDASSVTHVTRQSRIERQIRQRGQQIHGTPPTGASPSSPSGSTDAD